MEPRFMIFEFGMLIETAIKQMKANIFAKRLHIYALKGVTLESEDSKISNYDISESSKHTMKNRV